MKLLILIGAIVLVGLVAIGVWFLAENITFKKGKRK